MSNKVITSIQYYLAFAHWRIAVEAQSLVRQNEQKLEKILRNDTIGDSIYNPEISGTKDEFDEMLSQHAIEVDWLAKEKKTKKKEEKEKSDGEK